MQFPKPTKTPKRNKREINPSYVRWVHGWGCAVCKKHPVHAHHVIPRSRLGSDMSCIPLCHVHHTGNLGVHLKGVITFQKENRVDFELLVEHYNKLYNEGTHGPYSHLIPDTPLKSS